MDLSKSQANPREVAENFSRLNPVKNSCLHHMNQTRPFIGAKRVLNPLKSMPPARREGPFSHLPGTAPVI
jgi:hypothetical protein